MAGRTYYAVNYVENFSSLHFLINLEFNVILKLAINYTYIFTNHMKNFKKDLCILNCAKLQEFYLLLLCKIEIFHKIILKI